MQNQDSSNNSVSGSQPLPLPSEHPEFSRNEPPSEGRFEKFFQRINQFFKPTESPPSVSLQGRIHELQANAKTAMTHLIKAKDVIEKKSGDPVFIGFLNSVLDPFFKEISRIDKAMAQNASTPHQVKVSSRYSEWIEKAKWWTETFSKTEQVDSICPVLLDHAIEEFHSRLDRDIQVIQDYLNQGVQVLNLTMPEYSEVERRLNSELTKDLSALQALKTYPPEKSLESFNRWRENVDSLREDCFSNALHTIDSITEEIAPGLTLSAIHDQTSEDNPELYLHIVELEAKLASLEVEMKMIAGMGNEQKNLCFQTIVLLEKEANRLNGDLRLHPNQSDRVQCAIESLAAFKDQINH